MNHATRFVTSLLVAAISISVYGPESASAASVKPQLRGLLYMGDIKFLWHPETVPDNSLDKIKLVPAGTIDGVVINVTWAQLQPTPSDFVTTPIDDALNEVRDFNSQHPQSPLGVKLRVWQTSAPDWAKNLDGASVTLVQVKNSEVRSKTVGRFWSAKYDLAWHRLQTQLADKYDSEALIREVTNTSCSSLTDEPFNVDGDQEAIQNMLRAGFTDDAYRNCLIKSANDYDGWHTTSIDFAIANYRRIGSGRQVADPEVVVQIIKAFRTALGGRAILSNHALADPRSLASRGLTPVMDEIKQFGPPIEFQTANPNAAWLQGGQLNWEETIGYGRSLGATAIEVWGCCRGSGFESMQPAKLQAWSAALKSNALR
jgi:hypothetical protein